MAIVKSNSPLIGVSGRFGDVVTYQLNGTQVVRSRPYFPKRKPSPLQQQHRQSFEIQHRMAQSVKVTIINRIWKRLSYQGGMNAYNCFIQANRAAYGPSGRIEFPELMVISQGKLIPARNLSVIRQGEALLFRWTADNVPLHSLASDRLNIVLLTNQGAFRVIETGVTRETGQAIIPFSGNENEVAEGFVFWSSFNDKEFSPSLYWVGK